MTARSPPTFGLRCVLHVFYVCVFALGVLGCSDDVFGQQTFAFVFGEVTTITGTRVSRATVVLEVVPVGDTVALGREPTLTNNVGRYAIQLAVFFMEPFDAILNVAVTAPSGFLLQEGRVGGLPIRFNDLEQGIDTVRVDVILEPL